MTVCSNANTLSLLISLALMVPALLSANYLSSLLPGDTTSVQVSLVLLALLIGNILGVHYAWQRLNNQAVTFVCLNILRALIQATLVFTMLFSGYGVTGIMMATFSSSLLVLLISSFFHYKQTSLGFDLLWQKKLLYYGSPLIISGMANFVTLGLDNWWLAYAVGTDNMAFYALAMKFSMVTIILIQPFTMWWYPNRFNYTQNNEKIKQGASITQVGICLGFYFAALVTLASNLFIYLVIPTSYHSALQYLPYLCIIWSFKNMADLMNLGCYLKNTKRIMQINVACALFAIIGFYFTIDTWGNWGAIFTLLSVFIIRTGLFYFISQALFELPYDYLPLSIFIICSLGVTILQPWLIFGYGIFVIVLLLLALILFANKTKLIPINKLFSH